MRTLFITLLLASLLAAGGLLKMDGGDDTSDDCSLCGGRLRVPGG